jgi:chaperonin cofactor prefoldin
MKTIIVIILLAACGAEPASAQWAVFDVPNLTQSILNYAAMGEQIAKQATQINNQVQQIRQFETQLKRMGDMASVRSLVGFSQFRADLNLPTQIRTWADGLSRVNGSGLFGDTRGGVFKPVAAQFPNYDGAQVDRDPQVFKQVHDVTVSVDDFKAVQSDVYTRREDLKRAIASTSDALQAATTEAEEQKLQAVLNAQYGQLAAVDAEVTLSAAEVQVKAAEATAMNNAQAEADAEARRHLAQQEATKISTAFVPMYDCMLQYVTERRLSP